MRHQALSCHLLWHQALFLMEEKQELIQSSQHLHQVKVSTFGIKLGEKENVTTEFSQCHLHLLSFSYSVHPVHYYKQNAKKHSQSTTADYRSPFTLLQRTKQARLLIFLKKGCRELKVSNISYRSYWWHRNNISDLSNFIVFLKVSKLQTKFWPTRRQVLPAVGDALLWWGLWDPSAVKTLDSAATAAARWDPWPEWDCVCDFDDVLMEEDKAAIADARWVCPPSPELGGLSSDWNTVLGG